VEATHGGVAAAIKTGIGAATADVRRNLFLALAVRLTPLVAAQKQTVEEQHFWESGPEIVNIAASLTNHQGFASPFAAQSGPTAWIPPVYPTLLSLVFKIAGVRTYAAGLIILTIQVVFAAFTCFPVYLLAKRAFGEAVAISARTAWALFPYTILISFLFIWETTLSALLLTWLVHLSLDLPSASRGRMVTTGVLWGLAGLTNTALLSALPFCVLWPVWKSGLRRAWERAVVVGLVAVAVVTPWLVRDRIALGIFVPIRSNFGEELWLGNRPGGPGRVVPGSTS
jgi:hypothetical protein